MKATWRKLIFLFLLGNGVRNNPLSPLSASLNGAPKRPTPKANPI